MSDRGIGPLLPTVSERAVSARLGGVAASLDGLTTQAEDADHNANVLRVRRVMVAAIVAWTSCIGLDVVVTTLVQPGPLWPFLALRAIECAILGFSLWRMHRVPGPSPLELRVLTITIYTSASVLIGLMAPFNMGILSPYAHGVSAIIVVGGITMPDRWRRGAPALGGPALAYPLTVLLSALWSPRIAAQLQDGAALGVFIQHGAIIAIVWVMLVAGGHLIWSLRRQVFEAREIGRYKLRRRIGAGGMGDVWMASHATLKRDVAIKILRPDPTTSGAALERFEREVQATSELTHPNTVRVFDYGSTEDGLRYYVMELLEGESLGGVVERDGPLPPARALHLVHQAARAIAEAHGKGIVHRDIKPENLFVTQLGGEPDFLKVLDFGIAKVLAPEQRGTLTGEGLVVGTPAFMSPEQAIGQPLSPRFDVYSLGAVLYYLLVGKPPFEGGNVAQVMHAQTKQALATPTARGVRVPADLEAVVMRCLDKDPEARFKDAGALADALTACEDFGSWRAGGVATARAG
ncbi:MAG: serine/threonine protein kinase [Deltaproteobacteria bacterium]|nr:serine/threonine protein kinase [Deltaproteobacteria bacterium]